LGVEALQSVGLPPGRSPALADVMSNTVGGVLGALLLGAALAARRAPDGADPAALEAELRQLAQGWTDA
jgi:hypothetical protein